MTDISEAGFDPNLIFVSPGAEVSRDQATLVTGQQVAGNGSPTSLSFLSTPLQEFSISFHVALQDDGSEGARFRVGVWSVFTRAGYFLEFEQAQHSIQTETITDGQIGSVLSGGTAGRIRALGTYLTGRIYTVRIDVNRMKAIGVQVISIGPHVLDTITPTQFPELFRSTRLAVTASNETLSGSARATLSTYALELPHEGYLANKVDDIKEQLALVIILVAAAALLLASIVRWTLLRVRGASAARSFLQGARRIAGRIQRGPLTVAATACIAYLVGNSLLFVLGSHPFDMGDEKLYSYVARIYGPSQLYFVPNVVSLASIWGGVPYIESSFPYEPVMGYLFTGIGWMNSLVFARGGSFDVTSVTLEYLIKATNVVFGLGDSALIYIIARHLRLNLRWSVAATALFMFNPAVWFSMSVWGQTHVISIFFVLAAILLAMMNMPLWAWLALATACLTRPQMLVFGLLLGIVFLRGFSWKENAWALCWTTIVVFIALTPFTLSTSASLPIDAMLGVFRIQEAGGNELVLTTVSQDAYSVWPLVTYLAHGASGLERSFTPSSSTLVGPLTYQLLSQILTVTSVAFVGGALLLRRPMIPAQGAYIPFVALGISSFLMLLTGLVATHFLLALPLLLLCRRWMGAVAYLYVAAVWTVTTLVPMYGDMGVAITSLHYPLLAQGSNRVTQFVVHLYAWDRFITVGVVANICAVIWLGYLTFWPRRTLAAPAPVA